MSISPFSASLYREEAVLRFPFDEGLRQLLRAIPGRRWDPTAKAWCLPVEPEQAEALSRILDSLPGQPEVEEPLARALRRARARRRRDECLLELARPDSDWWFSFATDGPALPVGLLLEHPDAREIEEIGRALVPVDDLSAGLVAELDGRAEGLVASEPAKRVIRERSGGGPAAEHEPPPRPRHDIEFRRDRRGAHWILVGQRTAALARGLAVRLDLSSREGPAGSVGLAAVEFDAERLGELLGHMEDATVDPRIWAWLRRARTWRGNVEVEGPTESPVFLLLGDYDRLPRELRERATHAPGGATVPLTEESWRLIDERLDAWTSHATKRCVAALQEGREAPPAVLEISDVHEDPTFVLAPGHDGSLPARFGSLDGALLALGGARTTREHAALQGIRADPFCVPELDKFLSEGRVWVEEDALSLLQEVREEHAQSAGLVALSAAEDAELDVPGLGGELKPFQRAGVSYLLRRRRSFLADEQGLGKTIEALATLQAAEAFPAVIVCPANLKLNWQREIERWLPGRSVRLLTGHSRASGPDDAELTVVNYDVLDVRLAELLEAGPQALVIDEAHYCKNPAAKRTRAVQKLAAGVPAEGLVLALSGTPIVNRPTELISQLRILGRLADFGSGRQFGARFRGADAHQRLHWHLRARCYVRRLKRDVLPQLPAKTRAVVPVELDNEAEYRLAERDLLAWLRTQPLDLGELDAKVAAALRAERLVRLNALKLLAARGKLASALAWIHDFSSSGERLVVFARHREVQRAVIERFPDALHILGEDSPAQRDAALQAFQQADEPANQLIVCSMEVAGQGLTLTAASNVAFLELDWTPAKHDQAEDRCHRIGQRDAVTAYYLLAAETVDETIATLLERKRAVIEAVTDGREEDEEGVVDALVRELRGTPYRHLRAVA